MATTRTPGMSVRLKLTLSYAGLVLLAGVLLVASVWIFMIGILPDVVNSPDGALNFRRIFLRNYLPAASGMLVLILVFGLVGGWFLAGRMLAPLSRITDATRVAAKGSLSHRIRLEGHQDELRELADAFDNMLERLEAQVAEQRRFAANASHELRTPLAVTQALLDVAARDPNVDMDQLTRRLHDVNARAIALTEALLLMSRADQRAFTVEAVDLSLCAEEAAETLLPLAEKYHVTIDAHGTFALTVGSPLLLTQLVSNLLHNAVVHNLPENGLIEIHTAVENDLATLTIENTGGQLSPEIVATLTEPFQRATERINGDHAGVGLGLAIAQAIVTAHDGVLTLSPREGGGLRATVALPDIGHRTSPSGDEGGRSATATR